MSSDGARPGAEPVMPGGVRQQIRALGTVMALAYRAAPTLVIVLFVAVTLLGLGGLVNAYALKLLTDAALDSSTRGVLVAVGALVGGAALQTLTSRLYVNHSVKISERAQQFIDQRLISLTAAIPGVEHHESPRYADELSLLRERRRLLGELPNALALNTSATIQLVGSALLLGAIHPALLLLPLLIVPGLLLDARAIRVDERAREANTERRRERLHLFERATAADSAKEVRLFGLAEELRGRHERVTSELVRETDRANLLAAAIRLGGAAIFAAGFVGGVGLVLWEALGGRATPGEVVLAVTLARQLNGSVMAVANFGGYLRLVAKQTTRYLWLLDYSRDATRRASPDGAAAVPRALVDGITIERASFRYPGTEADVLREVSLRLPAGTVVALVGENGAGKTSLVKLLARFYEPASGRILVDGQALSAFDAADWQRSISLASQDFARFEFIAREAVGVGDLAAIEDRELVAAAIDRAGAGGVRTSLPAGLDTQLGQTWEGGVELSGGEWQQLALGRAFMRPEPLLLIFDEPTAAIDAPTEHALFERFAEQARSQASRGTVTLIVSHRFSTVRMADLIVVLDNGAVRESGSHEELMARDGLYAELYSLQARGYR